MRRPPIDDRVHADRDAVARQDLEHKRRRKERGCRARGGLPHDERETTPSPSAAQGMYRDQRLLSDEDEVMRKMQGRWGRTKSVFLQPSTQRSRRKEDLFSIFSIIMRDGEKENRLAFDKRGPAGFA